MIQKTDLLAPVITVDGPSASGKGTIASLVAQKIGFHYLDSGILYRIVAYLLIKEGVSFNEQAVLTYLPNIVINWCHGRFTVDGEDVSAHLRTPDVDESSSIVASFAGVRHFLVSHQKMVRVWPGLVTDGRDMGTVIFPDAQLKVFLTASLETRAKRRYEQLQGKQRDLTMAEVTDMLEKRDARDRNRSCSPFMKNREAFILDTTYKSISEVIEIVIQKWYSALGK